MRTKRSHRSINSSALSAALLLIAITVSLITASFAWFAALNDVGNDRDFTATTIAGYFADGDGSKDDPYIINNARHLYNLAWLQEKQVFTKYTYFKLGDDIDMSGMLGGEDGAPAGAIPPIGTKDNPFVGHFDGQGYVISNLWVSTNPDDWKEKPQGMNDYSSTHVGLFGAVGKDAEGNGAIIENFVLDRVEITCDIDATVGIICGYVGSMVNDIGVYNGSITVENGAKCKSNYSILGEKGDDITWVGGPVLDAAYGGPVGDLLVDPNDYFYEERGEGAVRERFNGVSGVFEPVPFAVNNSAVFVGSLTATPSNEMPNKSNFYEYSYETGTYSRFSESTNPSPTKTKLATIYSDRYSKNSDTAITIVKPDFNNQVLVDLYNTPNDETDDILLPKNSIWFKPQVKGKVGMMFTVGNMPGDRYASIYLCQRDDDGNLVVVEKKDFLFQKKSLKNGSFVYCEYEISDEEKAKNYEYIISGSNSTGHSVGNFYFLALLLAGTSPDSGEVDKPIEGEYSDTIYSVDYVSEEFLNEFKETDRSIDFSTIHMTLLHINEFTASGDYNFRYNAMSDGLVHYYDPDEHIEDYSRDKEATLDNTESNYEIRDPGGT